MALSPFFRIYLISSGPLKKYNDLNLGKLRYLASAIVVDTEARQTSKVIKLLQWLSDIGMKPMKHGHIVETSMLCRVGHAWTRSQHVSDWGVLQKSKDAILEKLSRIRLFEETDEMLPVDKKKNMTLELASPSDGREAVAKAANLLFSKHLELRNTTEDQGENIFTEAHMTEALRAVGCSGPDPDLLLIYGPARCHLGFPPWRLRYTEIVHMGPLNSMKHGSLMKAIYKFTLVRQNYGMG
ncbi:LOW QUALITY PROTEIN: dehydrodolichyl diphosphate synthase complex subunit NUS1-like [Eucalyptus grandis]|uniref:LOW QUALITY PROTEIN: dehydrodolichyl diphosphate synthase complex subunit NUS1-like n=1 Tax=Eucalyptus grandis TaxID=71139 RepID=UPI00192EE7A4|nr:LOW QUALITY PROTEIN: dehydrodolichyl diphosphate synthase complex subunit NUS1-like [Eucalyptus grandis]